jgi:hypothetical protein
MWTVMRFDRSRRIHFRRKLSFQYLEASVVCKAEKASSGNKNGAVFPVNRASGPNHLFNKFGPVDEASKLPTPFTPLLWEEHVARLGNGWTSTPASAKAGWKQWTRLFSPAWRE